MTEKTPTQNTDKEKPDPKTPSQAEGDEKTVDQALKNKESKDKK